MSQEQLKAQLPYCLKRTDFAGLGDRVEGKVRDIYLREDEIILITTDRVSAFDHVLGTVPFKGELLNRFALAAFESTQDILPNHLISNPDPNVVVARRCKPYPVEFVMRGYLTGSLWRDVGDGKDLAYGLGSFKHMKKDQPFEQPMLTPTTKAERGTHDMPISKEEILTQVLLTSAQWEAAEDAARKLYTRGAERAAAQGLILVDTKYELGEDSDGKLTLIDELHTPDSSRYWIAEHYEERFAAEEPQAMLDKENLRQWLIKERGFSGHGEPPALSDDIRVRLAAHYLDAHERLLGQSVQLEVADTTARLEKNLQNAGLL